ncbi:PAAR domain-containing protein [Chondromyces apiculatus]|uniref:Peptidase C39-like domain-containing protein n=1 Tax=Chondromyces apiculatus DSM 436 TaxID=1192034 RepID=A0A017SYD4_9BACT|nr:PAAR domain-containing protein [Chondromyces apiculatus]EYF01316.1 Hypothetical protein CAP_8470 [Chondromyces apiculatus DSM 436]
MPKAARVGDFHLCLAFTPLPHVGGPIVSVCSPNVETNSRNQARSGDRLQCIPSINFIVTGSGSVEINGQLAARKTDRTMHQPLGLITAGSSNVEIGGPRVGATLGNRKKGLKACKAARVGRNPPPGATGPDGKQLLANTRGQSYNNCGVESSRQIINQSHPGSPRTQEGLLQEAFDHGDAIRDPKGLYYSGGTYTDTMENILERNGVPAHLESGSMQNLAQAVAGDQGVIATLMAGTMWPVSNPGQGAYPPPGTGGHAVLVTGVEFDADGNVKNVIINDTGTGQCGIRVPASTFQEAVDDYNGGLVITDEPIW